MDTIQEQELSPNDHAFCEWVKHITARTKFPQAARQRIETLLSALFTDRHRASFRSSRFRSPI